MSKSAQMILRIWVKTLVRAFFSAHSGVLMLVFFLLFGFLRADDHLALGRNFIAHPLLLAIPLGISLVYYIRLIAFTRRFMALPENRMLYDFDLLPPSLKGYVLLLVQVLLLHPVLAYTVFLQVLAFEGNQWWTLASLLVFQGMLLVSMVLHLRHILQHPLALQLVSTWRTYLAKRFRTPLWLWMNRSYWHENALALVLAKAMASWLIWAVCNDYLKTAYDIRFLAFMMVLCSSGGFSFVFHYHFIENQKWHFLRQMPYSHFQRVRGVVISFMAFSWLECLVLIANFPAILDKWLGVQLLLLLVAFAVLVYGDLNRKALDWPHFIKRYLMWLLLVEVSILFYVPLWLITIALLAMGVFFVYRYYDGFEGEGVDLDSC